MDLSSCTAGRSLAIGCQGLPRACLEVANAGRLGDPMACHPQSICCQTPLDCHITTTTITTRLGASVVGLNQRVEIEFDIHTRATHTPALLQTRRYSSGCTWDQSTSDKTGTAAQRNREYWQLATTCLHACVRPRCGIGSAVDQKRRAKRFAALQDFFVCPRTEEVTPADAALQWALFMSGSKGQACTAQVSSQDTPGLLAVDLLSGSCSLASSARVHAGSPLGLAATRRGCLRLLIRRRGWIGLVSLTAVGGDTSLNVALFFFASISTWVPALGYYAG